MNFKPLNEATLHCLSLPNNKKVKDLLLHYFDVDNLNKIETVATIKATHENITENQFVFRHCYKLGGDNYSYIDVYTALMENRPIIIFDVLTRNEEENERVYSYICRKDCRLGNVLSPIRTGENQVEVCIQVTENINTKKLLDSIKVGLEKVRQLDSVKHRKIMKENDEIIIKIQKV